VKRFRRTATADVASDTPDEPIEESATPTEPVRTPDGKPARAKTPPRAGGSAAAAAKETAGAQPQETAGAAAKTREAGAGGTGAGEAVAGKAGAGQDAAAAAASKAPVSGADGAPAARTPNGTAAEEAQPTDADAAPSEASTLEQATGATQPPGDEPEAPDPLALATSPELDAAQELAAAGEAAQELAAAGEAAGAAAPEEAPAETRVGTVRTRWIAEDGAWETTQRGRQIMNDPRLYRGVAFSNEERRALGLVGLLPAQVVSMHEQLVRAHGQYAAQPTDLAKNTYLALLQDRNEVLFYRLLSDNLPEMLPVIYTPTVGEAIQHFSQEYRRPRGVFLSADRPEDIEVSLRATGLEPEDVDLIVATDGEAILGIGDWGVGGINISLGKLAVYTAAGGIDPGRAIAVMLDAGTNRQALLEDPLYLGNRHPRVDDATYDAFVDTFVEISNRLFPNALLHWEDLRARNARRVLGRWRDNGFTFNDDMQGTGAVALAAILSGLKRTNGRMADQRVVIFGAGTAGIGIAEQLREAMIADGLSPAEAQSRFWCVDQQGLLVEELTALIHDFQQPFARPDAEVADWGRDDDGRIELAEVIRHVEATVLIGTSGQPGAFTENIIRAMALSCQNPIILPLSNPTELVEAEPWDIMQWTGGRALVATGSAFDPVTYAWTTHYIGQANNAFVFPGLGLGAALVGAIQVTDGMLIAAAEAISAQVDTSIEGAPLLPEVDALHATSVAVAVAVGRAAIAEGVARWALPEPAEEAAEAAMWRPEYRTIRAV
jgi:malate dehydrogenase (oxaloacetate-decarboxylating)